jgi:hypothetical protein
MARKDLILSEESIESMAALGLTQDEMSDIVQVEKQALVKRYASSLKRGRARLAQSLRKAQIASALKGNASLLIWLGKVYLGQKEAIDHNVSAEHRAISITPNVLERLQTSYRLTMEQVRARSDARDTTPARDPGGVPGDRDGVSKTTLLSGNSQTTNGEEVAE